MKKNIKTSLGIITLISLISGNIPPVFAAEISTSTKNLDNTQSISKKVLTLDEAVQAAINNSDRLSLKSKEIKMYKDKMELQEEVNDFYDDLDKTVYDFPYENLELQKDKTKQSKEFMEDAIEKDIKDKYNVMVLKEIDINKSKRELEIKTNDLNFMKSRLEMKLTTDNELTDFEIQIEKLQNEIKAKENSLENNKTYFGILTGLDLSKHVLDENINYSVFKIQGDVDEYLDDKIDQLLKYNDPIVELLNDYVDDIEDDGNDELPDNNISKPNSSDYVSTVVDENGNTSTTVDKGQYALDIIKYQNKLDSYKDELTNYGEYLTAKYSGAEAQVEVDESRKNIKNTLNECYSTLLDLENKINTLSKEIKSTNTKLTFAKAQVDMGIMTRNEYENKVLDSEELDINMRQLVNTYNDLKDSIEKPWIIDSKIEN